MIAIITILSLLVVSLAVLVYINYNRAEKATAYCETYVRFVSAMYFRFYETRRRMQEIDHRGSFQADDEVGTTFKELDASINDLYEFITKYVNREEGKETEKGQD